ncbi:hypothetical protein [Streptomyces sp. NPDC017993]|uniref:hypothetical protein n=1 Tax=Streptomyces sp. NPDC017993 TaxID=3365027 RepID=UPI0037AC3024
MHGPTIQDHLTALGEVLYALPAYAPRPLRPNYSGPPPSSTPRTHAPAPTTNTPAPCAAL